MDLSKIYQAQPRIVRPKQNFLSLKLLASDGKETPSVKLRLLPESVTKFEKITQGILTFELVYCPNQLGMNEWNVLKLKTVKSS